LPVRNNEITINSNIAIREIFAFYDEPAF